MQREVYLDEGTTSWPKSEATLDALVEAAQLRGSSSRGSSVVPDRKLAHARLVVAQALGVAKLQDVLFVPGATFGLNFVLKGFLKPGDKVLVSMTEHNSVLRPLTELANQGVELSWMKCDAVGRVDVAWLENYLEEGNRVEAIVCQQGSNVTGILQPIEDICALGHRYDIAVIVDGSQAGGHLPLNLTDMDPTAWVCSGHKGFRGVKGVGVVYLKENFSPKPLVTGGTGYGDEGVPKIVRPDAYEAGTNPLPAILALSAAIENEKKTIEQIRGDELARIELFLEGISGISNLRPLGVAGYGEHLPILSVVSDIMSSDELAFTLLKRYGIETRSGVHCAPQFHKYLKTYDRGGAVRFSFSHMTPLDDLEYAVNALTEIFKK